jgi:hypothetical protein
MALCALGAATRGPQAVLQRSEFPGPNKKEFPGPCPERAMCVLASLHGVALRKTNANPQALQVDTRQTPKTSVILKYLLL